MRVSTSSAAACAAALFVVARPDVAWACAVCGMGSTTDNAWAYTAMSVMLTVLPLGMIGGVVYWVAQRTSAADAALEPGRVPPPGRPRAADGTAHGPDAT